MHTMAGGGLILISDFDFRFLGNFRFQIAAAREAVRLQPSYARPRFRLCYYLHWAVRADEAIDALKTATRLDPKPPRIILSLRSAWLGSTYVTAGRYDDAIASLIPHHAFRVRRGLPILGFLAAAYAATGQDEKARAVMKAFLDKKPGTTRSNFRNPRQYKRKEDRDRYLDPGPAAQGGHA